MFFEKVRSGIAPVGAATRAKLHRPQVVNYNLDQCFGLAKGKVRVVCVAQVTLEKISAVTLRVASMRTSVRFYRDLLGMEVIYGGEDSYFSSLRTKDRTDPILNLEEGKPASQWGRLIFYASDVDSFWAYLNERGLRPEPPRDASWANDIFICPIQMATSCHLLLR